MTDFRSFFIQATGNTQGPYPYQERFANAESLPHLLRAPTGAGKTATAILGWLWRWYTKPATTPRRLLYCLPMRVLVEQSEREANKWLANLAALQLNVDVQILMGGVQAEPWYLQPERPTILLGTQDMLLSRALNRGYAASRFHWPIDFGLLNNDCLWIFDEPQLMANGVSTSAQLAGLRKALGVFGTCPSVWMSATLEPAWLDTVDCKGNFTQPALELNEADYELTLPLHKRMTAEKTIAKMAVVSSKDMKAVAKAVWAEHRTGTQTLVIVNTVERAKATYDALLKERKKNPTPNLLLVHSRFRPAERRQLNVQLTTPLPEGRIIVATQVVEAGVDISAQTLFTELAPWASIVQRIGRCNRTGDNDPGRVFWIDLADKDMLPYSVADVVFARELLQKLEGASVAPQALDEFKSKEKIVFPFEHKHVLRRRDLLDLFDTTPDLSGNDIDIQRFVRSDDDSMDVKVFWRRWTNDDERKTQDAPDREELCNVPIGKFRDFLKGNKQASYVWDHLDEAWVLLEPRALRPGLVVLLPADAGGYSELGWDDGATQAVEPVPYTVHTLEESTTSDTLSALAHPLTIAQHTQHVCDEIALLGELPFLGTMAEQLQLAARWHDVGKAHEAFQTGMRGSNPDLPSDQIWAKSGRRGRLRHGRDGFRHELASALVAMEQQFPFVVAYLVAAHHGKVRLAIRSLPNEEPPKDDPHRLFALGVHDGDALPAVDLGGTTSPAVTLSLSSMQLGDERSWIRQAIQLLNALGPFKLAYLESLLRAADMRASQKEDIK